MAWHVQSTFRRAIWRHASAAWRDKSQLTADPHLANLPFGCTCVSPVQSHRSKRLGPNSRDGADYAKNAGGKKLRASLPCQACLIAEFYRFTKLGQDRFSRSKSFKCKPLRGDTPRLQKIFTFPPPGRLAQPPQTRHSDIRSHAPRTRSDSPMVVHRPQRFSHRETPGGKRKASRQRWRDAFHILNIIKACASASRCGCTAD